MQNTLNKRILCDLWFFCDMIGGTNNNEWILWFWFTNSKIFLSPPFSYHLHPSSHSPPSLLTLSFLPPFPHSPSFPHFPPSLPPLPLLPFVPHSPPPYRALPGHEWGAQSAHTLFWHFTGTSSNTHTHTLHRCHAENALTSLRCIVLYCTSLYCTTL